MATVKGSAENWPSWNLSHEMGLQAAVRPAVPATAVPIPAIASSALREWLKPRSQKNALRSTHGDRIDPLYLFFCSAKWHRDGDSTAGWELIHGLRSWDRGVRAVSAALMAKTERSRLLVRDLRRTKPGLDILAAEYALRPTGQSPNKVMAMNTPYGLEMIDSCMTCKLRKSHWFCHLTLEVLRPFSDASHLCTYPGGALLFVEGQLPRGAFVLCSGRVKLSTTSRDGKVLILKIAEPGEVLGLSAVISGEAYEVTAETASPCQVNFVEREPLIQLMAKSGELGLHSSQALSKEFQSAYRDIHDLVLARSSAGKLARLLLSWTPGHERDIGASEIRIRPTATHEEMAQMIGSSRETVTRLLSDLKKKEFIRIDGTTLVIRNRTALEAIAA
jgi:CRP/FNR family transcriptional regulator